MHPSECIIYLLVYFESLGSASSAAEQIGTVQICLYYLISHTSGTGLFETLKVGWTVDSQDISKSCLHKPAQFLWYHTIRYL